MTNLHKIKIESLGAPYARVTVDGQNMKCSAVDVHMSVGNMPETILNLNSDPELDIESLVTVDFTPKTVKSAVDVLKAALLKNDFIAFMGMSDLNRMMGEKNGK